MRLCEMNTQFKKEHEEEFREQERELYTIRENKIRLKALEQRLEMLKEDYDTLKGIDLERDKIDGGEQHSSVEDKIIKREHDILEVKENIRKLKFKLKDINIRLSALDETEMKAVELKYMAGLEYKDMNVYGKFYMSTKTIERIITSAVCKLVKLKWDLDNNGKEKETKK